MMYHSALNTIIISFFITISSYIEVGAVSYRSRRATTTSQRELGVGGHTSANGRSGSKGGKGAKYHAYYSNSYYNKYGKKIDDTDNPTSSPFSSTATTTSPTTSPNLDEPNGRVPAVMRPVPPDTESLASAPTFSPSSNVDSVQTVSPTKASSVKKPIPIPVTTELNSDLMEGDNDDPIIEASDSDSDSEGSELLILDSDNDNGNDNGGESLIEVESDGNEDPSVVNETAVDEDGPFGGLTEGGNDEGESSTSIDLVSVEMSTNETGDTVSMVQIDPAIETDDESAGESNGVTTPSQEIEGEDNTGDESDRVVTPLQENEGKESEVEGSDGAITPSQGIEGEESEVGEPDGVSDGVKAEDNRGGGSEEVIIPSKGIEGEDNTMVEPDEVTISSQEIEGEDNEVEGSSVEIEIGTGNEASNEGKENGNLVKYPSIGNDDGNAGSSGGKPPSQGVEEKDKEESPIGIGIGIGTVNDVSNEDKTNNDSKNGNTSEGDSNGGKPSPGIESEDNKAGPSIGDKSENDNKNDSSTGDIDIDDSVGNKNPNVEDSDRVSPSQGIKGEGSKVGGTSVEGEGEKNVSHGNSGNAEKDQTIIESGNDANEGGVTVIGDAIVEGNIDNGKPAIGSEIQNDSGEGGLTNENNKGNFVGEAGSEIGEVDPADEGGSGSNEADQEFLGTVDTSSEGYLANGPEGQTSDRNPANGPRDQTSEGNGNDIGEESDNSVVEKGEETDNGNNGKEGPIGSNTGEEVTVNVDESFQNSTTAVFCPDKPVDKSVNINWIYAVEFFPDLTEEQMTEAMAIMELKLVSEVLNCQSSPSRRYFRHRHLFVDNVAGLDYMPLDAKNEDVVCFSNSTARGVCETYFGRMVMYLENDVDEQVAVNDMLYSIRNTMQRYDFPSMNKIVQTWYLEPELNDASEISDGSDVIVDKKQSIDNSFSAGAVTAFAALGIFVIAALVLGIFRMRRRQPDGVSTLGPGSYLTTQTNNEFTLKQTPFSTMLPNSYKLDDPDTMSCIMEGDYDSDKCQNSVIVSDGGYTSDGGSQQQMMEEIYPPHLEPVLGAQKIDEENMETDRDLLFDNDDISSMGKSILTGVSFNPNKKEFTERDHSNHRKQNLVSGADVSLGGRHSSVDVHECKSANCKICQYQPKDVEFIRGHSDSPDVSAGARYHESYEQDF